MSLTDSTVSDVDVLVVGEVPVPKAYVFRPETGRLRQFAAFLSPGGGSLRIPLLAFVVHHPSGPILIDTGLHSDAIEDLRGDYGAAMYLLFRKLKPAGQPFDEQLRERGIEPGDVKLAVMTHLHVDHTGGMRLLPEAEFVCSREEWSAATGRSATRGGYVSAHLPEESRMKLVDFGADGEPYGPFTQTIDLLGDGTIRLVSTPGHTPGHLSVLLSPERGRPALLIGDAVYTLRSLREEILPLLTVDDELYLRSLRQLKEYAEQEPAATLVPTHDPTAWQTLRAAEPASAST